MKKGLLFVISGPSGAGKGTVCRRLIESAGAALSVSVTTREARPGEEEGKSYFFISRDRFDELVAADGLLEHAEVYGEMYGTPKDYVLATLDAGRDVILEIDIDGALQVKRSYPEAILVFILPPSMNELKRRLKDRQADSEEAIQLRLSRSCEEIKLIDRYDYRLVNDDLNDAVTDALAILKAEHLRTGDDTDEIIARYCEEDLLP